MEPLKNKALDKNSGNQTKHSDQPRPQLIKPSGRQFHICKTR